MPHNMRMPDKTLDSDEIKRNRERLRFVIPWLRYRGLKQRHIAEALDVSEPTVSKWLNGTQNISVSQFFAIAELLKAAPEDVLGGGPALAGRGGRYQRLAELAQDLPNDALDSLIEAGEHMRPTLRRTGNDG